MTPQKAFFVLALLSLGSCVDPAVLKANDAGIQAVQMAASNHDLLVDIDTAEKKRLSNALLYANTKAEVVAESQPTTRKTLDILSQYATRRTQDERSYDQVAERLKELNAAKVALELLQPGSEVLHKISSQQAKLQDMLNTLKGGE